MITTRNDIAGLATYWTLGEDTDFASFSDALKRAGFAKHTPERPTDFAALRDTLYADFGADRVDVVKNQPLPTFEVVKVKPQSWSDRNEYHHTLTARVTTGGDIKTDTGDDGTDRRLSDEFRRRRGQIGYHAVSRSLVDIIYALNGTTLRPSGGIYFLPNGSLERWEMVAAALEQSGPKNSCFVLRTILDEHSAQAIRSALASEIEREAAEIDRVLHDETAGLKAKATQKEKAKQLRHKIAAYESAFELALPDLRRQLDQATGREAIATLLESAAAGPILTDDTPAASRPLEFAFA